MIFTFQDVLVLIIVHLLLGFFFKFHYLKPNYSILERGLVLSLWFIHLSFAYFFVRYIQQNGGDSIGLWDLTADTSQYARSWMGYFGVNTFFIQWLNYIPSKLLGLSYVSGTMIYAFLSFWGMIGLLESINYLIDKFEQKLRFPQFLYLPLFLPGLHFWTAGVSKETLLFLGVSAMFYAFSTQKQIFSIGILGWCLCLLVRPILGVLFLPILVVFVANGLKKRWELFSLVIVICGGLLYFSISQFLPYLHLENYSWEDLSDFSNRQLSFLTDFSANTTLSMETWSWYRKLAAVAFLPFPWESWDFYSLIFSLENFWLLYIGVLGLAMGYRHLVQIPKTMIYFFMIGMVMFIVFTFTLNNLGLFYRMKSIWLPFLHITFLWLICYSDHPSKRFQ